MQCVVPGTAIEWVKQPAWFCCVALSVSVRFWKKKPSVLFGLLCRSVVKYKKRVNCLSCVCILHFVRRFSNPRFHDHILFDSVCNVKNVKALWEWLKYWLFVCDRFGFEKSHGNRNFGSDLLALVQFGFLKTEPKFSFCTSLHWVIWYARTAVSAGFYLKWSWSLISLWWSHMIVAFSWRSDCDQQLIEAGKP